MTGNNPWVVRSRPNPEAKVRLFCVPYAGGGPTAFHNWPDNLPPWIEVCAVQLPGRAARRHEAPFDRMARLVEAVTRNLTPLLGRPFALFGHSMGALVSFETARLLRRTGAGTPQHIFVSACLAPQVRDHRRTLHALSDTELIAELRRLNGIPRQVIEEPALMQMMLPAVRADLAVCETYAYSGDAPLPCPITAFGGLEDPKVLREELEPWAVQTSGAFNLHMLPGDHFFVHGAHERMLPIISRGLS